jgi:hypothetical protein
VIFNIRTFTFYFRILAQTNTKPKDVPSHPICTSGVQLYRQAFLTLVLDADECLTSISVLIYLRKCLRYLLERRLSGLHSRTGHSGEKMSFPAEDQSTTLRLSSQHLSHYTAYISTTLPAWFQASDLHDLSASMRLER